MSLPASLDRVLRRAEELRALLETADGAQVGTLSRELSALEPIVEKVTAFRALDAARAEAEALLADPEMRELAEAELHDAKARLRCWSARSASPCCRRTPPTSAAPSWRSAPPPAATRPASSPPSCSAPTSATPRAAAGAGRCWTTTRTSWAG